MTGLFTSSLDAPQGDAQLKSENDSLMEAMDFEPIEQLLGEKMPKLIPGEVGRVRLMESLRSTFGEGFRGNKAAGEAIKHFDLQTAQAKQIMNMREQNNV